ncbi:Unknown protein, partial [Striga hermonthica]
KKGQATDKSTASAPSKRPKGVSGSGSKAVVVKTTAAKKSKVVLPSASKSTQPSGSHFRKRAQDQSDMTLVPSSLKCQKGKDPVVEKDAGQS